MRNTLKEHVAEAAGRTELSEEKSVPLDHVLFKVNASEAVPSCCKSLVGTPPFLNNELIYSPASPIPLLDLVHAETTSTVTTKVSSASKVYESSKGASPPDTNTTDTLSTVSLPASSRNLFDFLRQMNATLHTDDTPTSSADDQHNTTTAFPKEAIETLFSHEDCQLRIDACSGSNACSLISARVAHSFLVSDASILDFARNQHSLVNCIRSGNSAYDSLSCAGFFSAEEVVKIQQSLKLAVNRDLFLRDDEWLRFQEELSPDARSSPKGRAAGILVATPYSFGICYEQGSDKPHHKGRMLIFDSHSHGQHGSLATVIPLDKIPEYMKYFLSRWYPFIPFCTGRQNVVHFSFLLLCT